MKKNLSLLLLVVLVALVALAPAASAKNLEGTTINVVMQAHNAVRAMADLLPEFEKETGIKVNLDILPQSELAKKAEAGFAARASTYDVVMMMIVHVSRYARAGWLEPIDGYIAESPDMDADDFMPGFLGAQVYKGKTYALPFYGESTLLMYRKDLFEEAGLSVPKTMDELVEAAKTLTKGDNYGIVLRGGRGQAANGFVWPTFLRSYGATYFDENLKPAFNSEEGQKATQVLVDLLQKYAPPGTVNMNWNEVQVSMQQGQSAMCIDGTTFAPVFEVADMSKVAGKIGYAPVPSGPAGRFPGIAVASIGVSSYSRKKEAAWEFIKWATGKFVQEETAKTGMRPDVTRNSIFLSPDYAKIYDWDNGNWYKETQRAMSEALPYWRPVQYPEWPSIGDTISIEVQSVTAGQKDLKPALDQAAKNVESIMRNAGYY